LGIEFENPPCAKDPVSKTLASLEPGDELLLL
jgi:hypothetical protein